MANSAYSSVELPTNVPGVGYTLKHRNAVEVLIKYYCKRAVGKKDGNGVVFSQEDYKIMLNRGKCHDMDKLCTSLCYPQLTADYLHRMFNGHHAESFVSSCLSKYDWIEMIFDCESARYTKPDKGKCAYEVFTTFNSHLYNAVLPYLTLFGFTKIDNRCVPEIKAQISKKVYETDLLDAITNYIHITHIHLLDGVSRLDDKNYMECFGQPTPFRHPATQRPNCLIHQRPTEYTSHSRSLTAREFVHGTFEAQVFDYDKLCSLQVADLKSINNSCLARYSEMSRVGKHR